MTDDLTRVQFRIVLTELQLITCSVRSIKSRRVPILLFYWTDLVNDIDCFCRRS